MSPGSGSALGTRSSDEDLGKDAHNIGCIARVTLRFLHHPEWLQVPLLAPPPPPPLSPLLSLAPSWKRSEAQKGVRPCTCMHTQSIPFSIEG